MLSVNCRVERKYDNNIYTISGCLRDFQRPFRSRDNNGHIYLVGFIIGLEISSATLVFLSESQSACL